jgi:glycosyltransferase involved in cell wall biosynthesis
MSVTLPELSIIVPVFNEESANLELLQNALKEELSGRVRSYELIFVDDGSSHPTKRALIDLADRFPFIKIVTLSRNFGEQAAILAGLKESAGEAVINMDSDLQDPPSLVPLMIDHWRAGADVIFTRQVERSESPIRQLQAKVFYALLDAISEISIPRDAGEFRLMSRRAVRALLELPECHLFLRGSVPWIGFNSIILPFKRGARQRGKSAYTMSKLIKLALQGLTSFSAIPLLTVPCIYALFTILGLALVCLLPNLALSPSSMLIIIFCLGVLQAFFFLFQGLYLTKILIEARKRPAYIVQEIYQKHSPMVLNFGSTLEAQQQ